MLKHLFFFFSIFFTLGVGAQTNPTIIYGNVALSNDDFPPQLVDVYFLNESRKHLDTVQTNILGNYVIEVNNIGSYCVEFRYNGYITHLVEKIPIDGTKDSIELSVSLQSVVRNENCSESAETVLCPHCKKNDKVYEAQPYLIVSYNFGDSKRNLQKYLRRRNRRGYETTLSNGKIVVWNVLIEDEREKFFSTHYCWFCVRDKKVF